VIAIVDYGMGNLRSVQKAVERVGGDARLARTADELTGADKVILPGVAAFGDAMDQLRGQGLIEPLRRALAGGVPYLGFCLGLQLLFEVSNEQGEHRGLGIFPGKVTRLEPGDRASGRKLSVPHMGWNQIRITSPCPLWEGIPSGAYVYFAHSYYVVPAEKELTAAVTEYGGEFTSAVWRKNVFATQFHPEKSQAVGLRLLENFVRL